jgi:hypothetical protein
MSSCARSGDVDALAGVGLASALWNCCGEHCPEDPADELADELVDELADKLADELPVTHSEL